MSLLQCLHGIHIAWHHSAMTVIVKYWRHVPAFFSKLTKQHDIERESESGARTKAITAKQCHERDVCGKNQIQHMCFVHYKQFDIIRAIHMVKVLLTVLHNNLRDTQSAYCACACCKEASVAD